MRLTDHETTTRAPDISPRQHAAVPPPHPSTRDAAAKHPRADSTRDARSSQTHDTHYARVVAQTAPEVRVARVEAARRALQEGTLTLDGQALADTLLQAVRAERRHA